MSDRNLIQGYYFITDEELSRAGVISDVENAVKAGVTVVQYRNKKDPSLQMYKESLKLREICRDILFIINDRIDIALAVDADGVHLGQDDMPLAVAREIMGPQKVIGVSAHNLTEAFKAEEGGADYLGVGSIFATTTKKDASRPRGTAIIREIKQHCKVPLVAIGGINFENAREVVEAGADALCSISAVLKSEDVFQSAKEMNGLFI